jgi:multiple sugar transport system permease protein
LTTLQSLQNLSWTQRRKITGILFVLPTVIFVIIFFIIPLLMTFVMSFHEWPLFGDRSFIGFDNYVELTTDRQFHKSISFTARYTLLVTPPIFILGFILASLVRKNIRGIGIFRTIFFMPVVIGLGVSSLLWVWLLNDQVGIINKIMLDLGLITKPQLFMAKPDSTMLVIIISVVWKTVGLTMILLLAGLQGISDELYESADVDGAGYFQKLRFITLPLMRRTIALALILSVIGSVLSFDQFYIMTSGGPRNSTISIVYWIYNNSFAYFDMGYGAAMSIILLIALVLLSAVQFYLLRDNT